MSNCVYTQFLMEHVGTDAHLIYQKKTYMARKSTCLDPENEEINEEKNYIYEEINLQLCKRMNYEYQTAQKLRRL